MKTPRFIPKEISWLQFNERVLQEANDRSVPLLERIHFLGIFSNNLDEFFRVRVADVRRRIILAEEEGDIKSHTKLLDKIRTRVHNLQEQFTLVQQGLIREISDKGIHLVRDKDLNNSRKKWVELWFLENMLPHIRPIFLNENTDHGLIREEDSLLIVDIHQGDEHTYAIINLTEAWDKRFLVLPKEKNDDYFIMYIDDVVRLGLKHIFADVIPFENLRAYNIKLTRDAELEQSQEITEDQLKHISIGLKRRLSAELVRMIYDRSMPKRILEHMLKSVKFTGFESLIPGNRYNNSKDFLSFPNIKGQLEYSQQPPITNKGFSALHCPFDAISNKDILLHYPYHSFSYFSELLRLASYDPKVTDINICIYRVASSSIIMEALTAAVRNGKNVCVIVELRARFDEQVNIRWAKSLKDAGVQVLFGLPNLKVHSKLCLISRKENDELKLYGHISTGNFHEKTARLYTDISLFTANQEICLEIKQVFDFIQKKFPVPSFKHLIVSPINSRDKLVSLIKKEISNKKEGKEAGIDLKINNLVDKNIITLLYEASCAGVNIRISCRGMCSLVPGIKNLSANIQVTALIDRYLEHSRIYIFNNNNKHKVYIASADLMTRNLDRRVEVCCPIFDKELKQQIIDAIQIHFSDNTKSRIIDSELSNRYMPREGKRIRSQLEIYTFLKNCELPKL